MKKIKKILIAALGLAAGITSINTIAKSKQVEAAYAMIDSSIQSIHDTSVYEGITLAEAKAAARSSRPGRGTGNIIPATYSGEQILEKAVKTFGNDIYNYYSLDEALEYRKSYVNIVAADAYEDFRYTYKNDFDALNYFEDFRKNNISIDSFASLVENNFRLDADLKYNHDEIQNDVSVGTRVAAAIAAVATLGSILANAGVAQSAITTFKVCVDSIIGAMKTAKIPFVGWKICAAIIAAVLVVLTVVIIVNWEKIRKCWQEITAWFYAQCASVMQFLQSIFSTANTLAIEYTETVTTVVETEVVTSVPVAEAGVTSGTTSPRDSAIFGYAQETVTIGNIDLFGSTAVSPQPNGSGNGRPLIEEEYEKLLKKIGQNLGKVVKIICTMTGVACIEDIINRQNKVFEIGRDDRNNVTSYYGKYYNDAKLNDALCFYSFLYDAFVKDVGQTIMDYANDYLVTILMLHGYDFIFCTDPYYYKDFLYNPFMEVEGKVVGGLAYHNEVLKIKTFGYHRFVSPTNLTWDNMKPIIDNRNLYSAYFAPAYYRVTFGEPFIQSNSWTAIRIPTGSK